MVEDDRRVGRSKWARTGRVRVEASRGNGTRLPVRNGACLISFLRTPPRLVDRGMSQSGVRMRHRGTDVAIVACLFLGGSALSMIPLGLLSSLVSPMDIPPWRTGAVLAGALVVGAGDAVPGAISTARKWLGSTCRNRGACGLHTGDRALHVHGRYVARCWSRGWLRAAWWTAGRGIHVGGMYRTCDAWVRSGLSIAHGSPVMRPNQPASKR
jgi:hypothetical protein